jgi:hypothetical protein
MHFFFTNRKVRKWFIKMDEVMNKSNYRELQRSFSLKQAYNPLQTWSPSSRNQQCIKCCKKIWLKYQKSYLCIMILMKVIPNLFQTWK